MRIAVRVEELSKRYTISRAPQLRYRSFRDALSAGVRRFAHRLALPTVPADPDRPSDTEDFWALRGVSFDINEGERVGIIGKNGAGKSTLLKILSRITAQTQGTVAIRGRIASLLEVGTGFHPELNGRENIFLNGALLGMKRSEIKKNLDAIVAFAEVDRFLYTPVKHYSSGMYVRLAFAVAAHLESEILIVDEVLAVGDAAFQTKCLGKMKDVTDAGRTVLFVSHNMGSVAQLCSRSFWLDQGTLREDGPSDEIITRYLTHQAAHRGERLWPEGVVIPGVGAAKVLCVRVRDDSGRVASTADAARPFTVEIEYEIERPLSACRVGFQLATIQGVTIFSSHDAGTEEGEGQREPGRFVSRCVVPGGLLVPSRFTISVDVSAPGRRDLSALREVLVLDLFGLAEGAGRPVGVIRPRLDWTVEKLPQC